MVLLQPAIRRVESVAWKAASSSKWHRYTPLTSALPYFSGDTLTSDEPTEAPSPGFVDVVVHFDGITRLSAKESSGDETDRVDESPTHGREWSCPRPASNIATSGVALHVGTRSRRISNTGTFISSSQRSMGHFSTSQAARKISSIANLLPEMPEFAQHWSVWGASGYLLKTLHFNGTIPYWACMSLTNIIVRTSLVPLVLSSVRTQTRFAGVAPEVQFLVTCFQKDSKKLKDDGAPIAQRVDLARKTYQTLRAIYKIRKVNPFDTFKSPLMQIPIFWYFSVDIRKIINGADPELAQQLTESGFLWVTDLTEPDPWYGLPILGGLLLYANVEIAMGKKTLSGETTSKSNLAIMLKDFFQSLAVFMPCFMSHNPAGVQIYLATSFIFTAFQGAALRNDSCRQVLGLPAMNAPPPEPVLVKEFLDMNKKGRDAEEERKASGEEEALGLGVLYPGFQTAFAGTARPTTIAGSSGRGTVISHERGKIGSAEGNGIEGKEPGSLPALPEVQAPSLMVGAGVLQPHMLKLPDYVEEESKKELPTQQRVMEQVPEEVMERANEGLPLPQPVKLAPAEEQTKRETKLNVKRFVEKRKNRSSTSGKGAGRKSPKKSRSRRR